MAGITIEKGKIIRSCEQPMAALYLITQGHVKVQCPGGSYQISVGDVIGICEVCSEIHFLSYVAAEDTTLMPYPLTSMEALDHLMQSRPSITKLFLLSLFRQFNALMEQSSVSEVNSAELYQKLQTDTALYTDLCAKYKIQSRIPTEIEEIQPYLEESPDEWLNNYYISLQRIYMGTNADIVLQEPGLSIGVLRKGSLDFHKTYTVLDAQAQYRSQIAKCYFSPSGNDLFDALTKLYYRLCQTGQNNDDLYECIEHTLLLPEKYTIPPEAQAESRVKTFRDQEAALVHADSTGQARDDSASDILQLLEGSLETILAFAGLSKEKEVSFQKHVARYKAIADKNSTDDECTSLRKALTEEFYFLYSEVFERSLSVTDLPVPVRMFLYFGYVDSELAGADNSVILYRLACYRNTPGQSGVYTFYDWLTAIYYGEKSPSRNDLDENYNDFIHKQKKKGNLSAAEFAALEENALEKVRFEMQNLFVSANKMTFGRITTFCPLFTEDNVLKDLNDSFVTPDKISSELETLKKLDFSAFYRETIDYENAESLNREPIHVEYLPDIILMPNAGIRGFLWQEIEDRKRSTPSRMILPAFYMENLSTAIIRMTGEFRWEMCKRVQGARWNDVSDPSLTSEYFDYMQFYRKNSELSKDAKEKLQNSLMRAKNNFREMFVRDYITWILYESNGSARLNKVARRILFTYCPFPASMDSSLEQNPMYAELLGRQKIRSGQRMQKLGILKQKLLSKGTPVPDCLEQEIAFAAREPEDL